MTALPLSAPNLAHAFRWRRDARHKNLATRNGVHRPAARFTAGTVPGQSGENQPITSVKPLVLLALPRGVHPASIINILRKSGTTIRFIQSLGFFLQMSHRGERRSRSRPHRRWRNCGLCLHSRRLMRSTDSLPTTFLGCQRCKHEHLIKRPAIVGSPA